MMHRPDRNPLHLLRTIGFVSSFEHSKLIRHSSFEFRVSSYASIYTARLRKNGTIRANIRSGASILQNF